MIVANTLRDQDRQIEHPSELPDLLTTKQVAGILKASDSLVRKLIGLGEIQFIDVGCGSKRSARIPARALREFMERRKGRMQFTGIKAAVGQRRTGGPKDCA